MHPQQPHFKLTRQAILLGIIAAAYPMAGYCVTVGRAEFVTGNVEAVAADGSRRALTKGSEISVGDAISTAAGARAQVRFIDGGFISLQPNTQFRVDQFNYQNKTDGEEKGFFSLLKGGLRAITGAIGHVNRDTYKVATPSATIGIRGTGYNAEIRDDGLFVSVGEGAISLTNNTGLLVVTAGNAAFVANSNSSPTPTSEQPQIPPAGFEPLGVAPVILPPTLPSLPSTSGYAMAYVVANCGDGCWLNSGQLSNVSATFNSSSQLLQFTDGNTTGDINVGYTAFSATDGIIGWGRWKGDFLYNNGTTWSGPLDYVIGIPTAVMPTGMATYNLMGYTNPMVIPFSAMGSADFISGYKISSGALNVNFDAYTVGVNMSISNSPANYYTMSGSVPISGYTFGGSLGVGGTACVSGCSASVSGLFIGSNASRAGLSYQLYDSAMGNITGVATFAKAAAPATPQ